ncbi:MAG: DUF5668 domain-containing protein [Patescibacteria group bacterium]
MYFGYFLILLGILWLLQEMGVIMGSFWGFVWPILVIFLGLSIVANRKDGACYCYWPWHKHHRYYDHDKAKPETPHNHPEDKL